MSELRFGPVRIEVRLDLVRGRSGARERVEGYCDGDGIACGSGERFALGGRIVPGVRAVRSTWALRVVSRCDAREDPAPDPPLERELERERERCESGEEQYDLWRNAAHVDQSQEHGSETRKGSRCYDEPRCARLADSSEVPEVRHAVHE